MTQGPKNQKTIRPKVLFFLPNIRSNLHLVNYLPVLNTQDRDPGSTTEQHQLRKHYLMFWVVHLWSV